MEKAFALLSRGDHFHYLFTDRDGTLKSYSCSYPASIQPAYSAVIQVCCFLLTLPLSLLIDALLAMGHELGDRHCKYSRAGSLKMRSVMNG